MNLDLYRHRIFKELLNFRRASLHASDAASHASCVLYNYRILRNLKCLDGEGLSQTLEATPNFLSATSC